MALVRYITVKYISVKYIDLYLSLAGYQVLLAHREMNIPIETIEESLRRTNACCFLRSPYRNWTRGMPITMWRCSHDTYETETTIHPMYAIKETPLEHNTSEVLDETGERSWPGG